MGHPQTPIRLQHLHEDVDLRAGEQARQDDTLKGLSQHVSHLLGCPVSTPSGCGGRGIPVATRLLASCAFPHGTEAGGATTATDGGAIVQHTGTSARFTGPVHGRQHATVAHRKQGRAIRLAAQTQLAGDFAHLIGTSTVHPQPLRRHEFQTR